MSWQRAWPESCENGAEMGQKRRCGDKRSDRASRPEQILDNIKMINSPDFTEEELQKIDDRVIMEWILNR